MALDIQGMTPLLWVYDMPASICFYRDTLGGEVARHSDVLAEDTFDWAMLRLGKAEFMLNTIFDEEEQRPSAAEWAQKEARRDCWLYFDCPDVGAAYDELHAKGIDVTEPVVTYYGMRSIYLSDPDGYRICFQSPAES